MFVFGIILFVAPMLSFIKYFKFLFSADSRIPIGSLDALCTLGVGEERKIILQSVVCVKQEPTDTSAGDMKCPHIYSITVCLMIEQS
jgi:hypothetical protein